MIEVRNGKNRQCVMQKCAACGTEFSALVAEVNRGNGKFCSRMCSRSTQARKNAAAAKSGLSRADFKKIWIEKTPIAVHKAHDAVAAAIAKGQLVRKPCEVCGAAKVDGHHDDYEKPLQVRWLCRKHHLLHHRSAQPIHHTALCSTN